jgi:hypothetical protein
LFECTSDGMEERFRACPGVAEEAAPTSPGKLFQFWPLEALRAGRRAQAATIPPVTFVPAAARCAQAATIPPVTVKPAAARAAPSSHGRIRAAMCRTDSGDSYFFSSSKSLSGAAADDENGSSDCNNDDVYIQVQTKER